MAVSIVLMKRLISDNPLLHSKGPFVNLTVFPEGTTFWWTTPYASKKRPALILHFVWGRLGVLFGTRSPCLLVVVKYPYFVSDNNIDVLIVHQYFGNQLGAHISHVEIVCHDIVHSGYLKV